MPKIETQGLSEDYGTATGSYESLDRGEVSKPELLAILEQVSTLTVPVGDDDCPPSVNTILSKGYYSCFFGDTGVIRCSDSQQETMTPLEAAQIMSGELTIEEFDRSKGFEPKKSRGIVLWLVVLAVIALAAAVYGF